MSHSLRVVLREGILLFLALIAGLSLLIGIVLWSGFEGTPPRTDLMRGNLALAVFFLILLAPTFETAVICLNYRLLARFGPLVAIGGVAFVFGLLHWAGPFRFTVGLYSGAVFAYFIWRLLRSDEHWATIYWTLALGHLLSNLSVLVVSRSFS